MPKSFKVIEKTLTPSGLWSNGLYHHTDHTLAIPAHILKDCIFQEVELKGVGKATRITYLNNSWLVI